MQKAPGIIANIPCETILFSLLFLLLPLPHPPPPPHPPSNFILCFEIGLCHPLPPPPLSSSSSLPLLLSPSSSSPLPVPLLLLFHQISHVRMEYVRVIHHKMHVIVKNFFGHLFGTDRLTDRTTDRQNKKVNYRSSFPELKNRRNLDSDPILNQSHLKKIKWSLKPHFHNAYLCLRPA